MGYVQAKTGLTRQLDQRQLENYFKPCRDWPLNHQPSDLRFNALTNIPPCPYNHKKRRNQIKLLYEIIRNRRKQKKMT